MKRRDFLKMLAGGAAVAAVPELLKAEKSSLSGDPVDFMHNILEKEGYDIDEDSFNAARIYGNNPINSGDIISMDNKLYRIISCHESDTKGLSVDLYEYDPDIYKF